MGTEKGKKKEMTRIMQGEREREGKNEERKRVENMKTETGSQFFHLFFLLPSTSYSFVHRKKNRTRRRRRL